MGASREQGLENLHPLDETIHIFHLESNIKADCHSEFENHQVRIFLQILGPIRVLEDIKYF